MNQTKPSQHWLAQEYQYHAAFVSAYGASLLDWLQPKAGEHILDLGCGNGELMAQVAESGALVLGVDGSADMVTATQARGFEAVCMDAQHLTFKSTFDAVFSNAALHWMPDAAAVLSGVAQALKPQGRFVAEMGGQGNIATIQAALESAAAQEGISLPQIWFFPDADGYATLLQDAGFQVDAITLFARPTPLPTGISGWLNTFAAPLLNHLPPAQQQRLRDRAASALANQLPQHDGCAVADYVRLRFAAHRP